MNKLNDCFLREGLLFNLKDQNNLEITKRIKRYDDANFFEGTTPMVLILLKNYIWVLGNNKNLLKKEIHKLEMELDLEESFHPVDLTEKKFISYLFESQFSDNLIECYLEGETEKYDYFESDLLYGSNINESFEFSKIIELEDVTFFYVKIQPKDKNEIITLTRKNIIKFDKNINNKQIKDVLVKITDLYEQHLKG